MGSGGFGTGETEPPLIKGGNKEFFLLTRVLPKIFPYFTRGLILGLTRGFWAQFVGGFLEARGGLFLGNGGKTFFVTLLGPNLPKGIVFQKGDRGSRNLTGNPGGATI